ncbi:MoaD/ThiS family protein [Galbibacter sp. PAP.153]|uniref:MoaD/ThiS family protein n=1 Tax=Galbibacter sp. PAP.153 TaxID=3104623 RepID=UPI00300BBDF7
MQVLLFGITKEIIGEEVLKIPSDAVIENVSELKSFLMKKYPALANLSSLAIAVNSHYAEDGALVTIDDEVALIPPVSGG